MPCPVCGPWLATSEGQLANRLHSLKLGAAPYKCPRCNSADWACHMGDLPDDVPVYRPTIGIMPSRDRRWLLWLAFLIAYAVILLLLWPSLPRAQTFEQRVIHDCSPDARRLCGRVILKGKAAIIACMVEHKDQLGKRCRAHFW